MALDLEQRFARAMKRGEKQDAKSKALAKKKAIKYFYKEGMKNKGEEETKHAMKVAFRGKK